MIHMLNILVMELEHIFNNIQHICIKVNLTFLLHVYLYIYISTLIIQVFIMGVRRYYTHLYVCVETLRKRIKRKREQSFSYFFFFTMLLFPRLCVPLLISQSLSLSLSRSPHTIARECVASSPPDCQHTLFALNNTYTHLFCLSLSLSI